MVRTAVTGTVNRRTGHHRSFQSIAARMIIPWAVCGPSEVEEP
jgi:hypothetical protein